MAWLEEAFRIAMVAPRAVIRFYPLAKSATDQTAGGAVITITGEVPGLDGVLGPGVQRLGEVLPGVLVPVHSQLGAALDAVEQQTLFPWSLHFIHPTLGITGFQLDDALLPSQLLLVPPAERGDWLAAVPGPLPPPPLRGLTLVQESSIEQMMAGDGRETGSEKPAGSGAGSGLLGKVGGAAAGMIGAMGAGLLGAIGNNKAAAAFAQWSQRQVEDLQDRRKKELNQLLERFRKNPDDALRHAIPLTGAQTRRGNAAAPGWKLGMRNPQLTAFSQGSGAVDLWQIHAETRLKLEKCYREAATHEAAAGQWGRAAYIYGELLGDWGRAAEMLENGGRPREAARIYMERMNSGLRAAQCMEKAGLLAEAASLYCGHGHSEKAGDLMMALGQLESARDLWEITLKGLINPLEKARLLETKLQDPERALLTLKSGWPDSPHAPACFEAWFALVGRVGQHGSATACLEQLEHCPATRLPTAGNMCQGLHTIFLSYPDQGIRDQAAALAPLLIGEALATCPSRAETDRLLALLPRFSPGDPLLARDAGRFSLAKNRPAVPLAEKPAAVLHPDHVIVLDSKVTWQSLGDSPQGPHAAGWRAHGEASMSAAALWAGAVARGQSPRPYPGITLEAGDPRLFHFAGKTGPGSALFHSRASQKAWIDRGGEIPPAYTGIMASGPGNGTGMLLLRLAETGTLLVNYHGGDGAFLRSRILDFAPPGLEKADWFMGAHGPDLWIAGMDVVCCVNEASQFQHVALSGPVTALAVAPSFLTSQAVAVGAGEAVLMIVHGTGKPMESINLFSGHAAHPPVAVFTADGRAVLADASGGLVYHIRGGCRKQADIVIPSDAGGLIAATAIGPYGFAFLTTKGRVLGYGY